MQNENETPTPEAPIDMAPDAPVADPTPETQTDPAPSLEEGAVAAIDEGLAKVTPAPEEPEPEPEPDAPADDARPDGEPKPEDAPAEMSADDEAASLGVKNERAKERFRELRALADEAKTLREKLPELEDKASQYDQMIQGIESTGATPEQYASALGYLRVVHHGTPAEKAQAAEFLRKELEWLEGQIGVGGDVLASHPDLAEAVQNGDIARPYAEELARKRALDHAQQQHVQTQAQRQQEQERQFQAQIEGARQELNLLGSVLSRRDPHFAAKVETAKAAFQQVQGSLPPAQWAAKFQEIYDGLPDPQPAAPAKPPVGAVPLRPQGAGAMGRAPSSVEDAIEIGLSKAMGA